MQRTWNEGAAGKNDAENRRNCQRNHDSDCSLASSEEKDRITIMSHNERSGPRAAASLEVDVEVSGETQRVLLLSKDIGSGGMYLRTNAPAPLWKRVRLIIRLPDGNQFEVGGEVVRSLDLEQAKKINQPAGMAVAFDEISRSKRKQLIQLVLDLCAKRPDKKESTAPATRQQPVTKTHPPDQNNQTTNAGEQAGQKDNTDELLGQLDALLDSVEGEMANDETSVLEEDIDSEDDFDFDSEDGFEIELDMAEDPAYEVRKSIREYKAQIQGSTHYDVLLLRRDATVQEINRAYSDLLAKLKPASTDGLAEGMMQELSSILNKIRKAFAILAKPERRQAYDFLIDDLDTLDL